MAGVEDRKRLERFGLAYIWFIETFAVFGTMVVVVVASAQVFFRYALGASLFWSEELMRYLMVWIVFLTAGIAYSRGELLGMRLLVDALPPRLARIVDLVARTLILIFLLVVAWYGFDFAYRTSAQQAVALEFSLFWVHIAIAVGACLLAIHVVLASVFNTLLVTDEAPELHQ